MLRDLLSTPLTGPEETILVGGICELLANRESQRFAGAVALITEALRRARPGAGLAFLRDIGQKSDKEQFAAVWPFLVNEILLTSKRADTKLFDEACAMAASLADEVVRLVMPELEPLEALRGQHVVSDVFLSPSRNLRRIFVWLLDTPRAAFIARQLVLGLRRSPTGWVGDAVLPLIEHVTPDHRRFLAELLCQSDPDRPTDELVRRATPFVAQALPNLARERRREPWVAGAVAALGRLRGPTVRPVLRRILSERRLLVLRAWPAECRRAARAALAAQNAQTTTDPPDLTAGA